MDAIVNFLNTAVWGFPEKLPWLVVVLLAAGFYVTLRLAVVQVRQVGHAILVVTGRFDDPDDPGDVNHFQALSTALSATVGIGNIAGVATAIHYGGPGAVFWMWVTAILGMALKFAECTLSVHYRSFDDRGEAAGGPMYYIERGLGAGWKPLAVFFAFCAILSSWGSGNMNQANTVAVSAESDFGVASWIVGGIVVVVVGAVILGGIKSIARVTSKLAPSMAVLYVLGALVILAFNIGEVPGAFATIVKNAFNPAAGVGGSVAGVWSLTLLWGVKRGLFSNEAGQGSAPIAHAAAKTNEPVREGAVAMLGPLIDTLIICSMTALVIVITGVWDEKKEARLELSSPSVTIHLASQARPENCGKKDTPSKAENGSEQGADAADPAYPEVSVTSGAQDVLVFQVADGCVDEARLLVGATDAKPFTGTLSFDAASGTWQAKNPDGSALDEVIHLDGKMLQNSSALTAWAFAVGMSPLGDWGNYIVTFCVFLFAVSTMISWSYYGDRCVTYLFGSRFVMPYRAIFLLFSFIGATTALETVWAIGDIALGLMTVPNLIAVMLLTPKIVELSRDYFERMKSKSGAKGDSGKGES